MYGELLGKKDIHGLSNQSTDIHGLSNQSTDNMVLVKTELDNHLTADNIQTIACKTCAVTMSTIIIEAF